MEASRPCGAARFLVAPCSTAASERSRRQPRLAQRSPPTFIMLHHMHRQRRWSCSCAPSSTSSASTREEEAEAAMVVAAVAVLAAPQHRSDNRHVLSLIAA